jgi:hypothetical protein
MSENSVGVSTGSVFPSAGSHTLKTLHGVHDFCDMSVEVTSKSYFNLSTLDSL